jgi:hypothetical protein
MVEKKETSQSKEWRDKLMSDAEMRQMAEGEIDLDEQKWGWRKRWSESKRPNRDWIDH